MMNPITPGEKPRGASIRPDLAGMLPTKATAPEFNDPHRLEVGNQIVLITFGIASFVGVAAAALVALDADSALALTFAALGLVATASGLGVIFHHRGRLIFSKFVTLLPIATATLCFVAGGIALAIGHSDYLGDGRLRSRWFRIDVPTIRVAHDSGLAVPLGAWAIKVDSARIVDVEQAQKLKIVLELSNPSTTTKLSNVSLEAARLLLRDDQGNRYAKVADEPIQVAIKDKGVNPASLYPGERVLWAYTYEPPIERAAFLNLTVHLSPLTPSQGLLFRIPKESGAVEPAGAGGPVVPASGTTVDTPISQPSRPGEP